MMMEWMILPLKRYVEFSGRSRRREFWMWVLFVLIAVVILSLVDQALGLGGASQFGRSPLTPGASVVYYGAGVRGGILTGLFALAILVPNVAVQVRRLHDTGRSGWWIGGFYLLYIAFIIALISVGALAVRGSSPSSIAATAIVVGIAALAILAYAVTLIVFFCLDSTRGTNRFGPDPKGADADLTSVFR